MEEVKALIDGHQRFYKQYFERQPDLYSNLFEEGQSPKFLVISCCDSRVHPAQIMDTKPGDIFVIRNVANLVPINEADGKSHGTSAAIEFAVKHLKVKHIIVFGHSQCGGIRTLMDADNTIEHCYDVTEKTLSTLFETLMSQDVNIAHTILKTNMVISGKQCSIQANVEEVAEKTVQCLLKNVPSALPGIVFLSGGQSAKLATAHLNTMNANNKDLPWPLSFSYGRALQEPCLKVWGGNSVNIEAAQKALLHREKCNGLACKGEYDSKTEEAA